MKIFSKTELPENLGIRVIVDVFGQESVLDTRCAWQVERDGGFQCGLAFTNREVPEAIARIMERYEVEVDRRQKVEIRRATIRKSLIVTSVCVLLGVAVLNAWT